MNVFCQAGSLACQVFFFMKIFLLLFRESSQNAIPSPEPSPHHALSLVCEPPLCGWSFAYLREKSTQPVAFLSFLFSSFCSVYKSRVLFFFYIFKKLETNQKKNISRHMKWYQIQISVPINSFIGNQPHLLICIFSLPAFTLHGKSERVVKESF